MGGNMAEMGKKPSLVCQDPQTDELTKTHIEQEKDSFPEIMLYDKSSSCPVASFEKCVSKLNPNLNHLWQQPKDSFDNDDNI